MATVSGVRPEIRLQHPNLQKPDRVRQAEHAAVAVGLGTLAAAVSRDALQLEKAARPAGLAVALFGASHAAQAVFPGRPDKPKHAMASALVTGTVSMLTRNRAIGIAAGVAAGLLKECYDGSFLNPKGDRDFHLNGDLGADAIGIAFGAVI